jgi:GR25 family glycosyltransferase involved in LPS biosynthesis
MALSQPPTIPEIKQQPFPITVNAIRVISIRPQRYEEFKQRFAPWVGQRFEGTMGDKKSMQAWRKEGYVPNGRKSPLRRGQLGCFHSHVRLWKHIEAQKHHRTLICEDDASIYFNKKTHEYLTSLNDEMKRIGNSWDIIMLGHHNRRRAYHHPHQISEHFETAPDAIGLFAYIISLRGVRKLLQLITKPYITPIDNLLSILVKNHKLNVLRVQPHLCFVVPVRSDTIHIT